MLINIKKLLTQFMNVVIINFYPFINLFLSPLIVFIIQAKLFNILFIGAKFKMLSKNNLKKNNLPYT